MADNSMPASVQEAIMDINMAFGNHGYSSVFHYDRAAGQWADITIDRSNHRGGSMPVDIKISIRQDVAINWEVLAELCDDCCIVALTGDYTYWGLFELRYAFGRAILETTVITQKPTSNPVETIYRIGMKPDR